MKLSATLHATIIEGVALGMHRDSAASAAGVPVEIFHRWEEQARRSRTGKAVKLITDIAHAEAARTRANLDDRSHMSRATFLARQLRDVTRACASAESASSWQALSTLRRQQASLHHDLDIERKSGNPEFEDMTEEQYLEVFREAVEDWPEDYFDLVFEVYEARHRVKLFRPKHQQGGSP